MLSFNARYLLSLRLLSKQHMKKEQKRVEVKITPQGSLGLLALGHVGLRKWREVRDTHRAKMKKNQSKKEDK